MAIAFEADNDIEGVRLLGNIEAEHILLGCLLSDNTYFDKVDFLRPFDFFYRPHDLIFEQIKDFIDRGLEATPVTIYNFMVKKDPYFLKEHPKYLAQLANNATRIWSIKSFAKLIKELSTLRTLDDIASDIKQQIKECIGFEAEDILAEAEDALFHLELEGYTEKQMLCDIKDKATEILEEIDKAQFSTTRIMGLDTGYEKLNKITSGLTNSELIILAGRPSMGKTAFAINLAINASEAMEEGSVLIVSLEMSANELIKRIISTRSRVNSTEMKSGEMSAQQHETVKNVVKEIEVSKVIVSEVEVLSISKLRTIIKRAIKKNKTKLVVIDYLQLMHADSVRKRDNKVAEITEISRGLKALAKEFDIPIVALSQLSRAVETREDKTPQLSDLRDSGSIEQDADVVGFLYREEYYADRKSFGKKNINHEELALIRGKADLIISKNRNGAIGSVKFNFIKEFGMFTETEY